mgnify:FL=1
MNTLFSFLHYIGIDDIFGILSLIGLASFLVRRFVLHKSPVPSGSFGKVSPELLRECVALLQKKEKGDYGEYTAPEEILTILKANPCNMDCLKDLLCDICAHVGIDGDFIELIVEDEPLPDRAGEISTDLAFTTIRLDIKPHHTVDAVVAVLAHETMHLHLYYEGIRFSDTWKNEILTDTAAVYCGFGEYIYRGYAVMQGEFALSYQKVGYIRQEDVRYIQELMKEQGK